MDHCDCFVHTVAVGGCNFLYPGGFYSFTACSSHNKCSYPDYKREKSIRRLNNKGLDISPFVHVKEIMVVSYFLGWLITMVRVE